MPTHLFTQLKKIHRAKRKRKRRRGREGGGRGGMYGSSESQGSSARRTCSASRTGFFVSGLVGPYFCRYNDVLVFPPGAAVRVYRHEYHREHRARLCLVLFYLVSTSPKPPPNRNIGLRGRILLHGTGGRRIVKGKYKMPTRRCRSCETKTEEATEQVICIGVEMYLHILLDRFCYFCDKKKKRGYKKARWH